MLSLTKPRSLNYKIQVGERVNRMQLVNVAKNNSQSKIVE